MNIHIIGPGGAGKTTTGDLLADKLDCQFIDLDSVYLASRSIDADISEVGYDFYARNNIQLYQAIVAETEHAVIALSSGFMAYDDTIHSSIRSIHESILQGEMTVLLLPSFNITECVELTIRRQLSKSHNKSTEARQRELITERFPIYYSMGSIRVATDKACEQVVDEIMNHLSTSNKALNAFAALTRTAQFAACAANRSAG